MLISKGNGYENEVEILIVDWIHWADLRKEEVRKWFAISGNKTLGKDKATRGKYVKRAKEEDRKEHNCAKNWEHRGCAKIERNRETKKSKTQCRQGSAWEKNPEGECGHEDETL